MSKVPWPQLPDNLSFDVFDDEDLILDYINSLDAPLKKIFFDALDTHSQGEDMVLYARHTLPLLHIVLMKFTMEKDKGLVLILSRTENLIYSHFERLKEQSPDKIQIIDTYLKLIFEQVRSTNEMLSTKKE